MLDIKGFIKTSLIDWDGKVTSVIFLPKCNFRCPFCHNHELVLNPEKYNSVSLEEIDSFLLENRDFIDGVVITGGEPTVHVDLPELCKHFKKLGLMVKLDTNGSNPEMLKHLIDQNLVDYVAMDIKAPLSNATKYLNSIGLKNADLDNVKKSMEILKKSNVDYEFRTTVVPSLHTAKDIVEISKEIGSKSKLVLQNFNSQSTLDTRFNKIKPYEREELEKMAEAARRYVSEVKIRA
jgi:pyruvate formate lyase activating enzyme